MMNKEKLHQILSSLWKNDDSVGKTYYNQALQDVQIAIDSIQEEPVSDRFAFKSIPRLLEMIDPTDRAKTYTAKLVDALEAEGYSTDAKIVRESLKIMNGEKVAMATMDGDLVSEELEVAAKKYGTNKHPMTKTGANESAYDFKAGAKWQEKKDQSTIELAEDHAMLAGMNKMEEQMLKDAVDGYVIEDIEEGNGDFLLSADYLPASMGLKDQQKVKVIILKDEQL